MKILLVDDDEIILEITSDYLKSNGYEVDCISDGKQVLGKIISSDYDLMVLDVKLPGLSGYEIMRNMKSEGIDIPVIMISSNTLVEARLEGFAMVLMISSANRSRDKNLSCGYEPS
jgi:DNA-binding response OmpR family regulator